jgi:hypothetical protein
MQHWAELLLHCHPERSCRSEAAATFRRTPLLLAAPSNVPGISTNTQTGGVPYPFRVLCGKGRRLHLNDG